MDQLKDHIRNLISQDKPGQALEALSEALAQTSDPELFSELQALSARFQRNEKGRRRGTIHQEDYNLEKNRIVYALIEILKEFFSGNDGNGGRPLLPPTGKKVFISYNHHDREIAMRLKETLEKNGIEVTIDAKAMKAGADIKEFIEHSIANTDITLSIVSNKSLLSGWVAMETVNTFYYAKFQEDKKFIACYIDNDFFNREFTLKAVEKIDGEIQEIESLMAKYAEQKTDSGDLNAEKTRLFDLRNNLNKIISRLRDSACIDIRGDLFETNLPNIIESIRD